MLHLLSEAMWLSHNLVLCAADSPLNLNFDVFVVAVVVVVHGLDVGANMQAIVVIVVVIYVIATGTIITIVHIGIRLYWGLRSITSQPIVRYTYQSINYIAIFVSRSLHSSTISMSNGYRVGRKINRSLDLAWYGVIHRTLDFCDCSCNDLSLFILGVVS
uniref:Uncharacterized protein n=1 Tax=Glossina pallidipes TaxID=7398 RepID=A0A1A9Z1T1_GLOPL